MNFLNPERGRARDDAGRFARMDLGDDRQSVRIDLWLDVAHRGTLAVETSVVSGEVDLAKLTDIVSPSTAAALAAGSASIACPKRMEPARHAGAQRDVSRRSCLPVYMRVTRPTAIGLDHPIYLID